MNRDLQLSVYNRAIWTSTHGYVYTNVYTEDRILVLSYHVLWISGMRKTAFTVFCKSRQTD